METNDTETAEIRDLAIPDRWVELYGDYLFKHALLRLREPAKAEDVVQETFLVALRSSDTYARKSAAKHWLLGILKNKIADHFRKASRETSFTDISFYAAQEDESFQARGLAQGEWMNEYSPVEWPDPGAAIDSAAFWQTFHACAKKLPERISAAFTLREVDGVDSKEICALLAISEQNLWVMLHRARMALRRCLEVNWFRQTDDSTPPAKGQNPNLKH